MIKHGRGAVAGEASPTAAVHGETDTALRALGAAGGRRNDARGSGKEARARARERLVLVWCRYVVPSAGRAVAAGRRRAVRGVRPVRRVPWGW